MEIQQLRHFVAVLDHGSFGAAARATYISQPGLSRSINALEARLGLRLLVRSQRGLVPTEAGASLLRHARTILNDQARAEREMAAYRGVERGHVSLGLATLFNHVIGPDILAGLAARELPIELSIETGSYDQLAASLATGSLDFALYTIATGQREPDLDADILHEPMIQFETAVFARADHPLRRGPPPDAMMLSRRSWLVSSRIRLREKLFDYFRDHGCDPPLLQVASSSLSLIISSVASGDILTVLPRHFEIITSGRIRPLAIAGPGPFSGGSEAGLMFRRGTTLTAAAQAVAEIARETARRHNAEASLSASTDAGTNPDYTGS